MSTCMPSVAADLATVLPFHPRGLSRSALRFRIALAFGWLSLFFVGPGFANPNARTPDASLDLHNLAKSQEILAPALPLLKQCAQTIPELPELPEKNSPGTLSKLHVALRQLRRAVEDLKTHGETAGHDLDLRVRPLERRLNELVERFRTSQPGLSVMVKVRQVLAQPKNVQARTALLKKLEQLVKQERWAEGYSQLNAGLDELTASTIFLGPAEQFAILAPFTSVSQALTNGRHDLLRKEVPQTLLQALQSQMPDHKGLLAGVTAASTALRSSASADVGGQPLNGPQCLQHFGTLWGPAQVALLRCRAIEWARGGTVAAQGTDPISAEYSTFCDEFSKALAALVEADAARAAGPDVALLYAGYLQSAAPLVCQTADEKLRTLLTSALEKLAAKVPDLARDVAHYRAATAEALRWRERVAATRAAARQSPETTSEQLLLQATTSKPDYRGLLPQTDPKLPLASLLGSCPEVLTGACPQLVDKPVIVRNVAGLAGGKRGVARYQQRHFATVALPPVDKEVAALKHSLFVTEQTPPLTLDAAVAVASAERGNYVSVGGVIADVYLEGLIPRFATLKDVQAPLVALGSLPTEPPAEQLLSHVLVRLDVRPTWVRHAYFFAEVSTDQ